MAVKHDEAPANSSGGEHAKGEGVARSQPQARRRSRAPARSTAARYDGWGFGGTMAGWLLLLLGQRVVDAESGLDTLLTALAALLLIAAFGQRLWAAMDLRAERKNGAIAMAVFSGLGLLALGGWYASSEAGRQALGFEVPKPGKPDLLGDTVTVAWIALLSLSVVPTVLGELARRSMRRAERVESRRVMAAVVAGAAVSLAVTSAALFTYGSGQLDWFVDYSYFRTARPSESTRHMLANLDEPLEVVVFYPGFSEVRGKVVRYLEDLRQGSDKLTVQAVDKMLHPELAEKYKVRREGVVVLVQGDKHETIDLGLEMRRAATKLKKLDGEFQKALLKVARAKRTAYLTVGHGELNEETDRKSMRTVQLLRQLIQSQNYAIKKLGLSEGLASAVPDDATVVLVLGPTAPFSEREVESLGEYAENGGSLLLALDGDSGAALEPLAAMVGVKWEAHLVLNDKVLFPMKRDKSDRKVLIAKRFSSHASVSTLSKLSARSGAAVLIPGCAPLDRLDSKDRSFRIDFAIRSVPGSYVDLNGNFSLDKDSEKKKTFNLAAAVSKPLGGAKGHDKTAGATEMRAFVLGDADALTDPVINYAKTNRLLFVEALRWLGGEESFSGEISSEEDVPIVHTKTQDQMWFYAAIIGVPALVVLAGVFITRRVRPKKKRRKRKPKSKPKSKRQGGASPKTAAGKVDNSPEATAAEGDDEGAVEAPAPEAPSAEAPEDDSSEQDEEGDR